MAATTTERPTGPPAEPPGPPSLAPLELARWSWRQLTSMRTALILLFLLALAAIPGSVVPQTAVDSVRASRWMDEHPRLTPVYERLGLFSVYDSVWFSAIYILLVISLVGCIVPRLRVYWRGLRAEPPRAPRRLDRLPEHRTWETDAEPEAVLEAARAALRGRRYRVRVDGAEGPDGATPGSVRAERGKLREAGNLVFHLSILVVLVGFAAGSLLGFKGGAIVVTGDGFANTLSQYDDFESGSLFDIADLKPFDFTVDGFDVTFLEEGRQAGMAQQVPGRPDLPHRARRAGPPAAGRGQPPAVDRRHRRLPDRPRLRAQHHRAQRRRHGRLLRPGGLPARGHDLPVLRRGQGARRPAGRGGTTQLGLEGEFYPTYGFTQESGPFSAFPDSKNPALSMLAYTGDLGLDAGGSQSVYALDKDGLDPLLKADGKPVRLDLALGRTVELPDGHGHGHLRRPEPLREAAGQPHAGAGHRARRA